ncbi:MAG TPA: hypothetical protein PLN94_19625 [Thiolinea sp.]|nr:hypothetical protein [Thiolinea sp.]
MGILIDLSQGCKTLAFPERQPYALMTPVDGTRIFVSFRASKPNVSDVSMESWPAAGGIQYTAVPGSWPDCEVPDEALAGAMLNPKVVREQGPSGAICPVPGSVVSPDDGTGHLTLIPIEPQGLCDSLCSAGGDLQAGDQGVTRMAFFMALAEAGYKKSRLLAIAKKQPAADRLRAEMLVAEGIEFRRNDALLARLLAELGLDAAAIDALFVAAANDR